MKKSIKRGGIGLLTCIIIAIGVIYFFPQVLYSSALGQKILMKMEGDQVAEFYFNEDQTNKDTLLKGIIYSNTLADIKKVLDENPQVTTTAMLNVGGSIDDEIKMGSLDFLTNEKRVAFIFCWLFILCTIEFRIPLVKSYRNSIFKTTPNLVLGVLLIMINASCAIFIVYISTWIETNHLGILNQMKISNDYAALLTGIIVLDFWAGYLPHVLMHKCPFLWRYHAVHHSDTMVDVTTTFRQHPIETIVRILANLTGIIILGLPLQVFLVYSSISIIHAFFEHANIRMSPKLDYFIRHIYVTPNMHKIHHSKMEKETDSNYGTIFSLWDRLFRTYRKRKKYTSIEYGLDYIHQKDFLISDVFINIPIDTKKNQDKQKIEILKKPNV